jgi:general secretion pathway protein F
VADTYDIETRNALDRLVALLVPAITVAMAVIVAVIILSVLMPIYDMTGNLG